MDIMYNRKILIERPHISHVTAKKKESVEKKKEHNICRRNVCAAYTHKGQES